MLNPLNLISKIFKSSNEKELDNLAKFVDKINKLEEKTSKLQDKEFLTKTTELKQKLKNGNKLNELLPEAFSLVREASKRIYKIKLREETVKCGCMDVIIRKKVCKHLHFLLGRVINVNNIDPPYSSIYEPLKYSNNVFDISYNIIRLLFYSVFPIPECKFSNWDYVFIGN